VSATCTRSPVQVAVVPDARPWILVLERRKGVQVQAPALAGSDQFDLHDVSFTDPRQLEVLLVNPEGQTISPTSDLGEHVDT